MRRTWMVALVVLALGPGPGREGRAEGEEPGAGPARAPGAPAAEEPLAIRVFEVGALTAGRQSYYREREPGPRRDREDDEWYFGAECEESLHPFGTVDELIERLKDDLSRMPDWTAVPRTEVRCCGEERLVLLSRRALADAVAERLAEYERRALGTLTLEVRAVRLPGGEDAGEGGAEADPGRLLASGTPGPSVVLTALPGQRAAAFRGAQRSFLAGYEGGADPAAAGDPVVPLDPVVDVANVGLMVDVATAPTGEPGTYVAEIRAALVAGPPGFRQVALPGERTIEAHDWGISRVRGTILLREGAWTRLDAVAEGAGAEGGRWTLLLRVHPNPYEARPGPVPLPTFEEEVPTAGGEVVDRGFDASALGLGGRCHFRGVPPPHLHLSHFDARWGEVGCTMDILDVEVFADFLEASFPESSWPGEGWGLTVRGSHYVRVRGPEALAEAAVRRGHELLDLVLWTLTTRASVVEVPDDLALRLLERPWRRCGAPLLGPEGATAIDDAVREGRATRWDALSLTAIGTDGTEAESGRHVRYLADYDLERTAAGLRPVPVLAEALSGFVLDVQPALAGGRAAVYLDVQAMRTEVPVPPRTVATPHGPLELPEMLVLRVRTGVVVPLGETAIVGAGGDAGLTRLLLVTPTLRRPGEGGR